MQVWSTIKTISANRNKGFTLVEIMVVIIVLGLLAVLGTVSVLNLVEKSKIRVFEEEAMTLINAARTKSAETIVPDEGLCYAIEDLASYIEKDLVGYSGSVYVSGDNNYRIWLSKNPYIINSGTPENINAVKLASFVPASESCPTSYLTITINANQGIYSGNIPNVVHEGQQITLVSPTKVGYLFTGWTVTGEGSSVNGNILTVGSENVVLSAGWTINSYTLTVNANGGVWNGTTPQTISYGGTTIIEAPTRVDYTFVSWTVTGSGSSINGTTFTMGSENTTITANWQINNRTLTVNANGGTWSGTTPQSIMVGSSVTISNPTKSGYVFLNWTVTGSGSSMNGTTFTMGPADAVITANWVIEYTLYAYTGSSQTYAVPATGYYRIELWGASGGKNTGVNGYGGYTSGYVYLTANTNLTVNVGGAGTANGGTTTSLLISGGYNGGGSASNQTACSVRYWGSGGGATDIRLDSSANSRIMVAGGGGGCYGGDTGCSLSGASICSGGGAGGSLIGQKGLTNNGYVPGDGATQTTGGAAVTANGVTSRPGTFGAGNGPTAGNNAATGSGGGYYGGAGSGHIDSSGGGSSFISGYAGVNAITSSSSTTATDNTKHYSNNYFLNGSMIAGVNNGNGGAKISFISVTTPTKINTNLNNVRYIKDCVNGSSASIYDLWTELQAIYNGVNVAKNKTITGTVPENSSYPYSRIVDGNIDTTIFSKPSSDGLQCITVDLGQTYNLEEVAVWHYWLDGRTINNNTTYASTDNTNWNIIMNYSIPETSQGKRVSAYANDYIYTGSAQTFTAPADGYYYVELWGARGNTWKGLINGGFGSYTAGKIYLAANTTLYIYVGSNSTAFNGGSVGGNTSTAEIGGGATDVRLVGGTWNDATGLKSRIMVAASGGGTGEGSGAGGAGGGITSYDGGIAYSGYGATQTAGGAGGANGSLSGVAGGFGYGGNGGLESGYGYGGGGGSGYYGGGGGAGVAGTDGAGGGGSSYISGHTGCVAITSSSSTSPRTGTGGAACSAGGTDNLCSIHYSGYYFTNTLMIDGNGYKWTNTKAASASNNLALSTSGYARITSFGS